MSWRFKALSAIIKGAVEGPLAGVDADVGVEVALLGEGLAAARIGTEVGPFSRLTLSNDIT